MDRDEEGDLMDNHVLEQRVYVLRKIFTHKMAELNDERRFYVCSLSTKTIVYKVNNIQKKKKY